MICGNDSGFIIVNFIYLITKQSPAGGAHLISASPEIPRILWKPKVYYGVDKCPPPNYPEPDQSSPCPVLYNILI